VTLLPDLGDVRALLFSQLLSIIRHRWKGQQVPLHDRASDTMMLAPIANTENDCVPITARVRGDACCMGK
jgi:hypothetical protein